MKRILAALAVLLALAAPAHAQKTKTQMLLEVTTNLPDNTSGQITPAIVRTTLNDIINSYLDFNGASSFTCAAHAWVSSGTTGGVTCTQPAFTDINGVVGALQGGAGSVTGALRANGAGTVTQAACADLSNGATGCSTATGTSGGTLPLNNGNNIFSGFVSYTSGRPYADVRGCGALGDGATDDTAAFNTCKASLNAIGGGTLYIPTGNYCVNSGLSSGIPGLYILGESILSSIISACGSNVATVSLLAGNMRLSNLTIIGKGGRPSLDTFSATQPAVLLGSGCIDCHIDHLVIFGGSNAVKWNTGEAYASYITATLSYGSAIMYFNGQQGSGIAGGVLYKIKPDSPEYPQGTIPPQGSTYAAWTNAHVYTAGTVVSATCQDGFSYFFQAMTGGTSGGAFPTCKNYGLNITDNTVTWQLNFPNPLYHYQFDTGSSELWVQHSDTGGGTAGFAMTNTGAGAAPNRIKCTDCNGGGGYSANVWGRSGSDLDLVGFRTGGCIQAGCSNILFDSPFTGNVTIVGGNNVASPQGIAILAGGHYLISNVLMTGNVVGVQVAPNLSNFVIANNDCSGFGSQCVLVQTGTSNNYSVVNNVCSATACVVDNGTGTRKTVMLNGNN